MQLGEPGFRDTLASSYRVRWVDAKAFYYDQAVPTLGFQSTELDRQGSTHHHLVGIGTAGGSRDEVRSYGPRPGLDSRWRLRLPGDPSPTALS